MHLRSIILKGFKSFPDRTRLEFAPGVSVIVGPNGSGKSNVTDAVLWALGEQSPLAVRGQTMQDVIFAGGHGLPSRSSAEVEVVIDNPHGVLNGEFSELSIVRRLDRSGEGEYRLNGARCRLVDVLEVLSDTGLGKEMHSVVSQGRVEAIIHSKPRDRRLLIEEAAGLGKHRKRRRRAQLKLERTQDNLDRALDVEREARSRLRPLKRQAEAAELHERLERQSVEARFELARDDVRAVALELRIAEKAAADAAAERTETEKLLSGVAARREAAEEAFAEHSRAREELSGRVFGARSAAERIALRLERARDTGQSASEDAERRRRELALIEEAQSAQDSASAGESAADRIAEIEAELAALGSLLRAGVVADLREGHSLLDAAGSAGGSALLPANGIPAGGTKPPVSGAERLLDHVQPADAVAAQVTRVLADAWVVNTLDDVPSSFGGIAVTRSGRVLFGSTGELRQAPAGGEERVLAQLGRRERLSTSPAEAVRGGHASRAAAARA